MTMLKHCLLLLTLNTLLGCTTPSVVLISTQADPAFSFSPPQETRVHVEAFRDETLELGLELTLEEKVLLDNVRDALEFAGFIVVTGNDEQADFTLLCRGGRFTEEYDSYERIPVTSSSVGWSYGRRGWRSRYSTHYSSVIVPARRQYELAELQFAAIEHDLAQQSDSQEKLIDELAVWTADVESHGPLILGDFTRQAYEAMLLWGRTADARIDIKPPQEQ